MTALVDIFAGERFVSASYDQEIRVWVVSTGVCAFVLQSHHSYVVALARLGIDTLVSGSHDKSIRCWSTRKTLPTAVLMTPSEVTSVCRIDSDTIASSHEDGMVRLWHSGRRELIGELAGHSHATRQLVMPQHGRLVSLAVGDNTLRVWNVTERRCDGVLTAPDGLQCCVALGDGRLIVGTSGGRVLSVSFPWSRRWLAVAAWVAWG